MEIKVRCNDCGEDMFVEKARIGSVDDEVVIIVRPCEGCMEEAESQAHARGILECGDTLLAINKDEKKNTV